MAIVSMSTTPSAIGLAMARAHILLGWPFLSESTRQELSRVLSKHGRSVEIATLAGYSGA